MTPDQTDPKNDNTSESNPVNIPVNFNQTDQKPEAEAPAIAAESSSFPPRSDAPTAPVPAAEPAPSPSPFVAPVEATEPSPTPLSTPVQTAESTPSPLSATVAANAPKFDNTSVMPSAAVGSPVVGSEIITGSNTSAPMTATVGHHGPRFAGKKRLFVSALSVFLVLALGAGYVFAFYIPNKPENVWKSSLVNTGKAYDLLSEYATKNKDVKGIKVEGSYKVKGLFVSDGSLSGKSVGQDGQVTGNFSAAGLKIGFDVRTLKSSSQTPDLYFKLTGLQGLGGLLGGNSAELSSVINGINNQWFLVDHTLFEQFGTSASETQFTKTDADNFLKAVGTPSKDYLFTADPEKSVLIVKETVGAEKKDGRNTYHYKVTYDKAHLGEYLKALCTSLGKDKIGKVMMSSQAGDCNQLAKEAASTTNNNTADVWVDKRTKLMHVIRFSDPKDTSNYVEVGQDYQGGDTFPFSLKVNAKEGSTTTTATVSGTLDIKANTLSVKGDFSMGGSRGESGTFSLRITPSNETSLKVDKPANAKTIIQLLDSLGLGSFFGSASGSGSPVGTYTGIQAKARDTERQTDIMSLHSHLEAYYAENGFYPTLTQLNNATWRGKNLLGIEAQALKDPQGTVGTLVASPAAHVYSYQGGGCTSTKCTSYTLTATLESGGKYTKTSLN